MDVEVEVIYPYEPQEEDELQLHVGDIITNVEYLEKGWCKGVLNKFSGAFPDNFVRTINWNRKTMRSDLLPESNPDPRVVTSNSTPDKREMNGRLCRAAFSYLPQHDDELTLHEGDILTVLEEVEEGWWKGILNGKVGMFPSNFVVDELDDTSSDRDPTPAANIYSLDPTTNTEVNGNPYISHTKDGGKGGDTSLMKGGKENDKITINIGEGKQMKHSKGHTGNVSAARISGEGCVNAHQSPPQLPPKPVRELARVMFPYNAEHDDELELREGEILTIISKDLEDRGWWKGELHGRMGVFPDNFVQIISAPLEEVHKPPRPEKRPSSGGKSPTDSPPPLRSSPASAFTTLSSSDATTITTTTTTSKDKGVPPPLPGKKMVPPPLPTEKKPPPPLGEEPLPDNASLTLGRENHLTHMARPKGPSNRRPPSQVLKDKKRSTGGDDDSEAEDVLEETLSSSQTPLRDETTPSVPNPVMNGVTHNLGDHTSGSPPPDGGNPPWLKELRENQRKKRLSGLHSTSEPDGTPPPLPQSAPPQAVDKPPATSSKPTPAQAAKPQISPVKPALSTMPCVPVPLHREGSATVPKAGGPVPMPTQPRPKAQNVAALTRESGPQLGAQKAPDPIGEVDGLTMEQKVDKIYNELLPKIRSLEQRLEEQQTLHSRQLQLLTKDLDEERKQRACLQIEVDRLGKLLVTGYLQV